MQLTPRQPGSVLPLELQRHYPRRHTGCMICTYMRIRVYLKPSKLTFSKRNHGTPSGIIGWTYPHFKMITAKCTIRELRMFHQRNQPSRFTLFNTLSQVCAKCHPAKQGARMDQLRPITRSNDFRCIASNGALPTHVKVMAHALGTEQHAIGQYAAAEMIARKLQACIEAHPDGVDLQMDATHALFMQPTGCFGITCGRTFLPWDM